MKLFSTAPSGIKPSSGQTTFPGFKGSRLIRGLLFPFFLLFFTIQVQAQLIIGWDASNNGGGFGASPWTPVTRNANLSMVNTGLIRGASIQTSGTPAGGCWGGGGGGWGTTDAGSVYFSFSANTGYVVSLSSISSALRRSSTGPSTCNVEYSLNGGAYVSVGTWNVSSTSGTTGTANSSNLAAIAALQNVAAGTVIKFRISFPGASGGNWYLTGATNSLRLNGTVVAVPGCTAPTGLAASNVTGNSADLNWNTISGVTDYEYVIDQTAAVPAGTGTAVTTNSLAAAGLNPGTVYYAHVRTDCGGSTFSTWTTTSFTTATGCVSPSVTAITSNTTVCTGSPLNLSVTATGSTLSYTWTGAGTIASANTATTSVTNATGSDYTVSISNACGTASSVVSVTVSALPSLGANSATICTGSTASLTASGANTYTWSPSQTTAGISVTPTSTTVYTVTGTGLSGCVNSTTTSVTVNSLPVISAGSATACAGAASTLSASGALTYTWSGAQTTAGITVSPTTTTTYTVSGTDLNGCVNSFTTQVTVNALPSVTANSSSLCAGSSTTLTASGASTYTWSNGSTASSVIVNPASTSVYTLSGTGLNGCVNSFTTQVTVNALPSVTANSSSLCAGSSTTLNASGASTYTWSNGSTTASVSVAPASTSVYTLSGTDLNGCVNSFTTQVTVNALPSVAVNSQSVCAGGTATLAASGAASYTWSTGQTVATITVSPAGTTTYTLSGTDLNGCSNSYTATVTVNPVPALIVNSTSICSGSPAILTASGVTTYTWSNGATGNSVTVNPTSTTVYTVSGNMAGCPVTVAKTATVIVNPLPAVSIASISTAICNTTNTVNLVGSPFGGSFSGIGIVGNTFSPLTAGTGTFVVSYQYTGTNACSGIAHTSIVVANCTGVEELKELAFGLYPNPAGSEIRLDFPDMETRTISIYSMSGVLVYSEQVNAMEHTLMVHELSRGLYVLNVSSTAGQSSKKILLQ